MRAAGWLAVGLALVLAAAAEGGSPSSRSKRAPFVFPTDFPERTFSPQPPANDSGATLELPESLDLNEMDSKSLSLINSIDNIPAFANLFNIPLPDPRDVDSGNVSITTRIGPTDEATMATCEPELRTVELDLPVEANTVFYPTCVRLRQCGGCCYGPLLTCRPTVVEGLPMKVLKTVVSSSSTTRRRRRLGRSRRHRREAKPSYLMVEAFEHVKCQCGCKVQEEDCNPALHTYLEGECACVCKNKEEKATCERQGNIKYWDNKSCNCYCRRPVACSTGQVFSPVSCRCE